MLYPPAAPPRIRVAIGSSNMNTGFPYSALSDARVPIPGSMTGRASLAAAHAARSFAEKLAAWQTLRQTLETNCL